MSNESFERGKETELRYQPYLDQYYKSLGWDYEHITDERQKELDVDRIVHWAEDREFYTEDKYVNDENYNRVFLETIQNSIVGSIGWIYVCRAKYIFYTFCNDTYLRVLKFDRKELKQWFNEHHWYYPEITAHREVTKPKGLLVPISAFPSSVLLDKDYFCISNKEEEK